MEKHNTALEDGEMSPAVGIAPILKNRSAKKNRIRQEPKPRYLGDTPGDSRQSIA